jgi:hypothetical protein
MKTKLIWSVGLLALPWVVTGILGSFYSPWTASLTVATLNGDAVDYSWARFVQSGQIFTVLDVAIFLAVLYIWIPTKKR